ncbi:RecX family transcriptional regulator [Paenibacillus sp. MBLB4367]|uniref:RecX family transcriptional regulator n=1 Tax=Paenibacillus sp. MBLB4367 TaxID=3384767 RepID=UPI0039082573
MNQSQESVITSVEQQKRNKRRYNIFVDESFAFSVHEDILIKYRLLKGETIDNERMLEVIQAEERQEVYAHALRYIGRSPRSMKEVRQKLKLKGYEQTIIDLTIERLKNEKLIDDGMFAMQWTEHRIMNQSKGRNWVKQELQQKGIASENIQEAIASLDEEAELANASKLAAKKLSSLKGEPYERKQKLASFLLRRGYTSATVSQVLKRVMNESLDDWEF